MLCVLEESLVSVQSADGCSKQGWARLEPGASVRYQHGRQGSHHSNVDLCLPSASTGSRNGNGNGDGPRHSNTARSGSPEQRESPLHRGVHSFHTHCFCIRLPLFLLVFTAHLWKRHVLVRHSELIVLFFLNRDWISCSLLTCKVSVEKAPVITIGVPSAVT